MLVGEKALRVLTQDIIRLTPIIAKVWAYVVKEPSGARSTPGKAHLVIHFITDAGPADTIVMKLCNRAEPWFTPFYLDECPPDLEEFRWAVTGKNTPIPVRAQLLYVRPLVL